MVKNCQDELIEYIKDANGIIVGLDNIDECVLSNCPNLKIILSTRWIK